MSTTNESGDLPGIQVEWTARRGDARRATLATLAVPQIWRRAIGTAAVCAAIFAAVCIATGSGWSLGGLIGVGIFALFSVVSVVACLVGAHVQNRRILKAGATWRAGSDDEHLRVDTPVLTLLLRREGLQLSTPLGKHLVLVKAGSMKQGTLLPAALLVEPVCSCTESGARRAE